MSKELDAQAESVYIENLTAVPAFKELVDFASEVCLDKPERVQEIVEVDRAYLGQDRPYLNVWASRAAFERSQSLSRRGYSSKIDPLTEIAFEDVISQPERFGPAPIPEVQLVAKAFGEALLEEAFNCLGEDAAARAEDWRRDESFDNRISVINWLLDRVREIHDHKPAADQDDIEEIILDDIPDIETRPAGVRIDDTNVLNTIVVNLSDPGIDNATANQEVSEEVEVVDNPDADDERFYYHPLRLSPKVMGTYPETTTKPTCLAISVLLASFFHKAGAPLLHAGVMRTAGLETRRSLMLGGDAVSRLAEHRDIQLPDHIMQNIIANGSAYSASRDRDNGIHAAVLVKAAADSWICLDPNYNTNIIFTKHASGEIDELRRGLWKSSYGRGGVEQSMVSYGGKASASYELALERMVDRIPKTEDLDWLLDYLGQTNDPIQAIKAYIVEMVKPEPDDESDFLKDALRYHVDSRYLANNEDTPEDLDKRVEIVVDWAIEGVVASYLFPDAKDGDFSKSLERCQRDQSYRQNRLDDLAMLPSMYVMRLLSLLSNDLLSNRIMYPHSYLEVGLPEHRIGMCALSDFAVYCGDDLPPSFWTSHWASNVAWSEHSAVNVRSQEQYKVARSIARLMETSWLTYSNKHEKISEFLEQGAVYRPKG